MEKEGEGELAFFFLLNYKINFLKNILKIPKNWIDMILNFISKHNF